MDEEDVARAFHLLTRHGSPVDRSALVDFRPLDPPNRPAPFKRYPDLESRPLPRAIDEPGLGRLLFFTGGVSRASDSPAFEDRTYFRTAMSAGNLHPVELYVVGEDGVHHYDPLGHDLTQLRAERFAGTAIVFTGIPWRTAWKYGERGYRHLYWDAGGMAANLLAVAAADGRRAHVFLGFDDENVARLVGVDGTTEFPLAIVTLDDDNAPDWPAVEPVQPTVEAISPRPIAFPLIEATQDAGKVDDVAAWRAAAADLGEHAPSDESTETDAPPIEQVILQRGSTRLFRRDAAPRPLLDQGMAMAARAVPGDFVGPGRTLLEHNLSIHDVEGVEPGAYRWKGRGALEPVHLGDHRAAAQLLTLRQPLGGDSAYTAFHCAPLGKILDSLGARGYRAAQFEAGVAAGRLSLAAFALDAGATGLTFFDDAVSQFFATTASCMLVTAVGIPAYRNAAGGAPGAATELTGYGRLMERLSLQLHRAR